MSTLAGMRQKAKDWVNRRDITDSQFDTAINLAVTRLERSLRLPSMEGVLEPEWYFDPIEDPIRYQSKIAIPADFLEMKEIFYNGQALERRDLAWVKRNQETSGTPCWFARHREFIEFAPLPENNGAPETPLQFTYYFEVPELIADTDSNWFLQSAEGAVLYGTCVEIYLYLKDQDEAAIWEQKFQGEAQAIQQHADSAEYAGSTLTIKSR